MMCVQSVSRPSSKSLLSIAASSTKTSLLSLASICSSVVWNRSRHIYHHDCLSNFPSLLYFDEEHDDYLYKCYMCDKPEEETD